MSPENLSRRAILAGAAAVPALALPAVVAAAPTAPDATCESAIVARAEQIVDLLRTRRICEGWKLDEVRADQFLQNVRRLDLKAGDTDLEGEIIAWAHDHGQSLDWLLEGDPIRLVCGGAAQSICAPNPDAQIVALAERVMRTHDAYGAACEACYGAPDEAMTDWRKHNPSPDKSAGADEYKAAMARWRRRERAAERRTGCAKADASRDAAGDAAWDAIHALRDAVPATVAGLAAKARAWRYLEKDLKEQADDIVYSLAKDVTIMAGEVDREAVQS
jgi:hypothetical protein